jgi:hypothetical protein
MSAPRPGTAPSAPAPGGAEPPVDEDTFAEVLADTVGAMADAGVAHLLMGGISSAVHGRPRLTRDIDVFVRSDEARRALEALADRGFETEETYWDWLFKGWKNGVLVDVIFRSVGGAGGIRLDEEMLERAQTAEFHGVKAPMMPPEDLLVVKAVVHDEHLPRHWHDALAVIGRCELDWDYLLQRARAHGARRVLSLLVYAQSNDLIVPNRVIERLFDDIYRS